MSSDGCNSRYNGLGQRVSQEVSSVVTDYLLDVQPGLYKVLAATTGGNTDRYIHDIMGIHSQEDHNGNWTYPALDHLGSVRAVFDDELNEDYFTQYAPYGDPFGSVGSNPTPYGFTGEPTDGNGLVHLRARYYNPDLGNFISLDPLETANRYAYANENPVNLTDPTGLQEFDPTASCELSPCDLYLPGTIERGRCLREEWLKSSATPTPALPCGGHEAYSPEWFACDDLRPKTSTSSPDFYGIPLDPECQRNRTAVLTPYTKSGRENIKSVGVIVSAEVALMVGFAPSVGLSVLLMFDVDLSNLSLNSLTSMLDIDSCHLFIGTEAGASLGLDPFQGGFYGAAWSTAQAENVGGFSANISGDWAGFNLGLSRSAGSGCNYSAFAGHDLLPLNGGAPTISFTFGGATDLSGLLSCKHVLDIAGITISEIGEQIIKTMTELD